MNIENVRVFNFENALRGMRNPKESWDRSDSKFGFDKVENLPFIIGSYHRDTLGKENPISEEEYSKYVKNVLLCKKDNYIEYACIGKNDMKLATTLVKAGPEHRKFLRQIFVSLNITAPLYWFKEFDTYKVGTVANSTSTMHKLTSKPITIESFEIDDFNNELNGFIDMSFIEKDLIPFLENLRLEFLIQKDKNPKMAKKIWKELVRWLPEGWSQTRTVTLTYENLLSICEQRKNHKLNEWSGKDNPNLTNFISIIKDLPYVNELVFYGEN